MSDAVLRALELAGISFSSRSEENLIAGYSFLGKTTIKPGVTQETLSVWHAVKSHIPLTKQDADRLLLRTGEEDKTLLVSERELSDDVMSIFTKNGVEVWERQDLIEILGQAELSHESEKNDKKEANNEIRTLPSDSVLKARYSVDQILGKVPIDGNTRPVHIEVRGYLASAMLRSEDGDQFFSSAVFIESPWNKQFESNDEGLLKPLSIERLTWDGDWTDDEVIRSKIKSKLARRISKSGRDQTTTSLLRWYHVVESTLKIERKRVWAPSWILIEKESGEQYILDGLDASANKRYNP